jgi:hypothetical protein
MKHRVADLDGALLDAAAGMAEGDRHPNYWRDPEDGSCWVRPGREEWAPSSRWDQGGPIIERERIMLVPQVTEFHGIAVNKTVLSWLACVPPRTYGAPGETPLIAAMRAYVASKFGAEVDL